MSRILLVDDDDLFRKMLRITLANMGYDVREAHNGKEAVQMFEQELPDLVLTDIIMPDQEGLETIGILRRRAPNVKIIAMSGGGRMNARDYLKTARSMGAHRVLAKPFSNDELKTALDELLRKP